VRSRAAAHLSLALVGEGESFYKSERLPSGTALSRAGLQPVTLEAKEGLALLNGTQGMHAVEVWPCCARSVSPASPM
jgi:histidine ammonia-lyase